MIASFKGDATKQFWETGRSSEIPSTILKTSLRNLTQLHAATALGDLSVPPGNRLEPLVGDREGQYSIRINQKYRVCFRWEGENAYDVEICDYHG